MARDPEVVLQRKLPSKSKIMVAGRGPMSDMLRYFMMLPQANRRQYTIKFGTRELNHLEIERIAREAGLCDGLPDLQTLGEKYDLTNSLKSLGLGFA